MLDNRLDFIENIKPEIIEEMTALRKQFIRIDNKLKNMPVPYNNNQQAAQRTLAIARTHLETSLQYAIKTLCLCGEVRE